MCRVCMCLFRRDEDDEEEEDRRGQAKLICISMMLIFTNILSFQMMGAIHWTEEWEHMKRKKMDKVKWIYYF